MELFNRVYEGLVNRRERVLTGKINCIPFGLPRFEKELPGIERERYYLISANQKVGKTKVTNFLFLFNPIFYAYKNRDKIKLKIFYFSLEISTEELYQEFICHLLYVLSKGKIRIDVKDLKSTSNLKPLPEEILELMNSDLYKSYFQFFEECVEINESVRNPFGIYKMMRDYAHSNGTQHKKKMTFVDNKTGEESYQEVDDFYEPNNPDEYVLGIVDNINLLTPEAGMTLKQSIDKFSSDYCIKLRNKYKYIPVIIQQQASAQEGIENFKLGKIKPSADGLAESKLTARDCNYLIGLYTPHRYEIPSYLGYDIKYYQDNIRFMEIIASRHGGNGNISPLYFDGATSFFAEMPKPDNIAALKYLNENVIEKIRTGNVFLFIHKFINKLKIKDNG